MSKNYEEERAELRGNLAQSEAGLHVFTIELGDRIAKEKKYKGLDGIEAIILYLVNKHHWLPNDVRSLSTEDLRLVLNEEFETYRKRNRYDSVS